ncbi:P-loop containing nucleoside triphosphate hydrolase protein [Flagelloscypha sp. PMI_526]|nr:P-loop containing nucleoside triphosphate hydrolase protein [Flagelloscypha sp. PMI_526]
MGNISSTFFGKKEYRKHFSSFPVGLTGSGKTSLLHRMAYRSKPPPDIVIPTSGFETIHAPSNPQIHLQIWDIGGADWNQHLSQMSKNCTREWILGRSIPLVVVLTKLDLTPLKGEEKMSTNYVLETLGFFDVEWMGGENKRKWICIETSAMTGEGVDEILRWLTAALTT